MTTRAAFDVSGSFMAETLTLAGLPMKGAPGARRRLATGDFCHRNWRQQPFQVECSLAAMRGGGLGGKGIYIYKHGLHMCFSLAPETGYVETRSSDYVIAAGLLRQNTRCFFSAPTCH